MFRSRTPLFAVTLALALSACTGKESQAGSASPSSPSLSESRFNATQPSGRSPLCASQKYTSGAASATGSSR